MIAPVIHPVKCHVLVIEHSFLHFLSILVHWLSNKIKVPVNLIIMSTVLNNIESINKIYLLLFIYIREYTFSENCLSIHFAYLPLDLLQIIMIHENSFFLLRLIYKDHICQYQYMINKKMNFSCCSEEDRAKWTYK